MKRGDLEIGLLTVDSLGSVDAGERFLRYVETELPEFVPEKFDSTEPLLRDYDSDNLSEVLGVWGASFFWKRRQPRLIGRVWSGSANVHDAVYISAQDVTASLIGSDSLVDFVVGFDKLFRVEIGYIHLTTPSQTEDRDFYIRHVLPFTRGLTVHDLKRGLPGMCWGMLFGESYVNLIGRETLLSAPAYRVFELFGRGVFLQLTSDMFDLVSDCQGVDRVRTDVVNHIGLGVFSGFNGPASSIPEFRTATQ